MMFSPRMQISPIPPSAPRPRRRRRRAYSISTPRTGMPIEPACARPGWLNEATGPGLDRP
ncbi:hypothetical protein [Ornithinimicrobium kibberense]|uniref:hypothetical protein n=1 Tax=Ornithinimicrobium kibberense TaxID=282060 RepID=UPI00360645A5